MAVLAVAAAGAWAGSALITGTVLGMSGAAIGWMAGSMLGNALFAPTQKSQGPKLNDLTVSGSAYGQPIPWVAGSPRIAGQVVWASPKREIATTESAGGKGGGGSEYTSYTYEVDLLILLTDNVISGVPRAWKNGKMFYDGFTNDGSWSRITVYNGSSTQLPDPDYEAAVGTANASAYRGRGTVFIKSLQLGGSGQIPNLTFEVMLSGSYALASNVTDGPSQSAASFSYIGSCAVSNSRWRVHIGQWDNNYATKVVNVYDIDVLLNTSELVGSYSVANALIPGAGNVDVSLFGYQYGNAFRVHFAISNSYTVFALPENLGNGKVRFAKLGNDFILGSSGFGAKKLHKYTAAGSFQLSSASLSDHVNSILIIGSTVYALSKNSNLVYVLDLATLTLQNTVSAPYHSSGADLWAQLFNFGGELGYISSSSSTTPAYGIFIYRGGTWVAVGSVRFLDMQTTECCQSVSAFGNILIGGCGAETGATRFKTWFATLSIAPNNSVLQSVVESVCVNSGLQPTQYDATALSAITRPVRALAISQVSSARTVLDMLATTYQFEAVLSDKIYFRPRGGAPVATLTFDELGVMQDSTNPPDPLPLTQANELEIPAQLALTYNNIDGDYQTDTQYSDRLLTGMESTSAMQLPLGFTASEAKQIVDTMLLDKAVSALSTSITLDTSRAALQPTDVLLITGEDSSSYRMRIVKRTDAVGVTTLQCVADNASVLTQAGTTSGGTASQTTVATLASTILELMDIPLLRDADNAPGHYVAVKGSNSNWTNCALYDSPDDLTFTQATTISGAAVMGSCTSMLGNWVGGNLADESNTLTVSVGDGQLYSVTHEGMLSNSATNAALVGSEIIQFREAALVSAGVYTLRGLLRGRRGTEAAMAGHAANERFVLLAMTGLRFVPRSAADLGRTVYYKAATASQKLSAVASQNLVFQSRNLLPMRPTNVRVNAESADTLVSWDRRTRVAENWLLGSVPLGEPVESWKIEVYAGATLKRTLTSTTASVTYTNAQRYEDFGGAAGSVDFAVYQISTYVGQGDSVTTTTVVPVTTPPVNPSAFISTDLIYPVCKAGSAFIAIRTSFSGSMAQHQLLQSTNGGATLTAVSSASVFLSKKMATARADGVYVSLPQCQVPNSSFKEFEAFSRAGEISIMRGVAGSAARYATSALPLGNDPMGLGCNGSNFYILMEGNHVWKSTDGDTWTDTGAASGFPYTFSSSYAKNIATRNYTASSNLHWTGSAWLFAFSNKLYRTSDADALSGWAEVAWAGAYYYGPTKFVQSGSVILAALYEYNNPSMMRFERSTDHGASWSVVWDRQAISPAALPLHLTLAPPIAIDGEFVASTSNGEYRRIYSSANGTVWTIGSNDPNAGWSTYMDQISDGTNVLGYSRGYLADFVYSPDGMTYLASDTP